MCLRLCPRLSEPGIDHMGLIRLKVEATCGLQVEAGDTVKKGDKIGMDFDFKSWVVSPVAGKVKDIHFDADDHSFVIEINEENGS